MAVLSKLFASFRLRYFAYFSIYLGLILVLGPGSSIPNAYDMLFLLAGVFCMGAGAVMLVASLQKNRED